MKKSEILKEISNLLKFNKTSEEDNKPLEEARNITKLTDELSVIHGNNKLGEGDVVTKEGDTGSEIITGEYVVDGEVITIVDNVVTSVEQVEIENEIENEVENEIGQEVESTAKVNADEVMLGEENEELVEEIVIEQEAEEAEEAQEATEDSEELESIKKINEEQRVVIEELTKRLESVEDAMKRLTEDVNSTTLALKDISSNTPADMKKHNFKNTDKAYAKSDSLSEIRNLRTKRN